MRKKAAERLDAAKVERTLSQLTEPAVPVENPLLELQKLAGEVVRWKDILAAHVAELEKLRYTGEAGEHIRGEVVLFERALDRCASILLGIGKLNLDERLTRITEAQIAQAMGLLDGVLADCGLDPASPVVVAAKARRIAELVGAPTPRVIEA